ncbi:MAG: hypothetical protein ABIO55_07625 [Ginsengibacter sp.]
MSYKNIVTFFIIFFGIYAQPANAQSLNITGDTIFVNAEAEIQVNFPTLPKSFSTLPNNAPYSLKSLGTGVNIIAKSENTKPATLLVSEGGRNHHFVVVFKKDINYNNDAELVYDYSTVKKLEQHIREIEARKVAGSKKTVVKLRPVEVADDGIKGNEIIAAPVDNSANYYALLEQGDKEFKQQNYGAAKSTFDKAHILRPDDVIPLQRLDEIKMKLGENETSTQQENYKNYVTVTGEAKVYLDQKKYKAAQDAYKQALSMKPGDLYATHQLEIIAKLLLEENGQQEAQKLKTLYNEYIAQGEKAFNQNQYTNARIAYEQALSIRPNDGLATGRLKLIDEKEKRQTENEELENNYNTAIQSADKLFQAGDFNNAKTEYNKANSVIKRSWPQDQIKRIDKILIEQIAHENIEKQKRAQRLDAERQEKEKLALEISYDAAIQSADKYFKAGDYENAKIEYNKALDFIKKDWPADQINTISKIIADQIAQENIQRQERLKQDLENKYNAAMLTADKYFQAGDYANAKVEYNRAMSIIPKPLPQTQIKKINEIIAAQVAQANAEKLRLAEEAVMSAKYTPLIKSAEIEFDKSNYIKAKRLYTEAFNLKPSEEDPKERLLIIETILNKIAADKKAKEDSIALAKETNRKYSIALLKGRSNYQKDDLLNAKISYEEATNLKPSEEEPRNQLKIINYKLEDIAREIEMNNNYESNIVLADSQLIAKAYESATNAYKAALSLKPSEAYPKAQLKYIQSELADIDKRKEIKKREDDERRYNDALARANTAVKNKMYDDAKSAYTEALSIHSDNDFAKRRLEIVSYQVEKLRDEERRQDSINKAPIVIEPVKKSRKNKSAPAHNENILTKDEVKPVSDQTTENNLVSQKTSKPYSDEELKSKYPGINFAALPPEQPFNQTAVESRVNLHIYDTMLLEKPGLNLSTVDGGIKLICQGINFEETNAYIKFLIENSSNTDFLTGAMMLTWIRKQGNRVRLYPNHIFPSPLPVVKPGDEVVVIYVCKTYDILDGETLGFELIDRLKKFKLQLTIPGSAYNAEWVRYK